MINWRIYNFDKRSTIDIVPIACDIPKNCCLASFIRIYKKNKKTKAVIKLTIAKTRSQYHFKIASDFSFGTDEIRNDGALTDSTVFDNLIDALDSASQYVRVIMSKKLKNDYVAVLQK